MTTFALIYLAVVVFGSFRDGTVNFDALDLKGVERGLGAHGRTGVAHEK
jgi:hypothetical protein